MPRSIPIASLSIAAWLVAAALSWAQAPVEYRLSFADYVRHVVDVDVVFSDVTADPLDMPPSIREDRNAGRQRSTRDAPCSSTARLR